MFHDLDATLAALVRAELSLTGVDISFVGPDDQFPPAGVRLPALSFFLYDVREHVELRTGGWDRGEDQAGAAVRRRPAARVACSYLVTAWPSESTPDPAQDEHRLLGETMRVLLRHRRIPAGYLQGGLIGQEPPMPARITAENRLQSLGEFWQALGGRPKAALHYGVTLSVELDDSTPLGPQITERRITIGQAPSPG